MSLYEQWKQLTAEQSEKSFDEFWEKYSDAEIKIYSDILANSDTNISGTFS